MPLTKITLSDLVATIKAAPKGTRISSAKVARFGKIDAVLAEIKTDADYIGNLADETEVAAKGDNKGNPLDGNGVKSAYARLLKERKLDSTITLYVPPQDKKVCYVMTVATFKKAKLDAAK